MICDTCIYKPVCDYHREIENVIVIVEDKLLDDEGYTNRILETINSFSECFDYEKVFDDERVHISKKEYEKLLEIKAMYEGLEK